MEMVMEIPRDILECVLRAVMSYADFARAATVSREWNAVAVMNRPAAPMLLLPSTAAAFHAEYAKISPVCWLWRPSDIEIQSPPPTSSPAFLRVFGKGASILSDDDDCYPSSARFIGSFPGGWVALALDGWRGYCLVNINTGVRLPLPDLVRTPVVDVDCVVGIKSLALSAAPTTDGTYLAAAITSGAMSLAFWRSGLDRWCPPTPRAMWGEPQLRDSRAMQPRDPVEDLLYYRGFFYVLDGEENLTAYMEDKRTGDDDGALTMRMVKYHFLSRDTPGRDVLSRYLVQSDGRILMVRHIGDPVRFEYFLLVEEVMMESDTMAARWVKCSDLGGRALLQRGLSRAIDLGGHALFLGRCCSRSVDWYAWKTCCSSFL